MLELIVGEKISDESGEFECSGCGSSVKNDDDFCSNCGTLFAEGIKCVNHKTADAEGVCVICCEPFCKDCGLTVNDLYFSCDAHSEYEIIESMARVFGTFDDTEAQYIKSCLEQGDIHPILFNRNQPSKSSRSINVAIGTDFLTPIENETKVMVPCQEVIKAEEILEELEKQN